MTALTFHETSLETYPLLTSKKRIEYEARIPYLEKLLESKPFEGRK